MQRENEDETWRAIVENYGDRVDLGPDALDPGTDARRTRESEQPADPASAHGLDVTLEGTWQDPWVEPVPAASTPSATGSSGSSGRADGADGAESDLQRPDDDPFVPPAPPPLPRPSRDRLIAWVGIFGSPTILLVALIAQVPLPTWLAYLLVAGFVGGFLYLVFQMPRGPRDPFDDGARL